MKNIETFIKNHWVLLLAVFFVVEGILLQGIVDVFAGISCFLFWTKKYW